MPIRNNKIEKVVHIRGMCACVCVCFVYLFACVLSACARLACMRVHVCACECLQDIVQNNNTSLFELSNTLIRKRRQHTTHTDIYSTWNVNVTFAAVDNGWVCARVCVCSVDRYASTQTNTWYSWRVSPEIMGISKTKEEEEEEEEFNYVMKKKWVILAWCWLKLPYKCNMHTCTHAHTGRMNGMRLTYENGNQ